MAVGPPSAGKLYTPAMDLCELFGDVKGMRLGVLAGRYGGGELSREQERRRGGDLEIEGLREGDRFLLCALLRLRPRLRLI